MRLKNCMLFCMGVLVMSVGPVFGGEVIFYCGNHIPRHAAQTIEQAKSLGESKGCIDWDVSGGRGGDLSEDDKKRWLGKLRDALSDQK